MSTQINVTVGSGGLSDKARQLQTAARQAQLEKERKQRIETKGQEQRNAKLEAEGKTPDGSPLYGARFEQTQVERRPAASRSSSEEFFLLRPDTGPINNEFLATSKKLPEVFSFDPSSLVTFSESAGPSESPALQAIPPADNVPNFVSLVSRLPEQPLSKYANKPLKDYTLQVFVKLAETYVFGQDSALLQVTLQGYSDVDGIFYGFSVQIFAELESDRTSTYACSNFYLIESSGFAGDSQPYVADQVDLSSGEPKVAPGLWNHLVISRKGSTLYAFLNGQLLGTAISISPSNTFLRRQPGLFPVFCGLSFGQSQVRTTPGQTVSVHGLRFDTKCLYTSDFSPPSNL